MVNDSSIWLLMLSTAAIALVHTLAPDHWVPFVSIGRARKWTKTRLFWVTLVSGIGHVGSSIVIGCSGLILGYGLTGLQALESRRTEVAGLLLIGFGLAYTVWGLKAVQRHKHRDIDPKRSVTIWTLFAIFVLGPCEPLIPLMFVSIARGWGAVIIVTLLFSVITLAMMIGQTLLAYVGIEFLNWKRINHHYHHAIAGLIIAFTGITVMILGV